MGQFWEKSGKIKICDKSQTKDHEKSFSSAKMFICIMVWIALSLLCKYIHDDSL